MPSLRSRQFSAATYTFFILMTGVPTVFANDAKRFFDEVYGPKIKIVQATSDYADDLKLATAMLAEAGTQKDTPALARLFCNAAAMLGERRPEGFAVAADALQMLAGLSDEDRAEAHPRLNKLYSRMLRSPNEDERTSAGEAMIDLALDAGLNKANAGHWSDACVDYRKALSIASSRQSDRRDLIRQRLEYATRQARVEKQIERLNEALLQDANNSELLNEIINVLLSQRDDLDKASQLAARTKDPTLKKRLELVKRPITELNLAEVTDLAKWYSGLLRDTAADKTADVFPPVAKRTIAYWKRFLDLYPEDNLERKKATINLKDAEAMLAKAEAVAAPVGAATPNQTAGSQPSGDGPWTLVVNNDDDNRGFTLFINGQKSDLTFTRVDKRTGEYVINGGLKSTDVVIVQTTDRGEGAFVFCLVDAKGRVLNYSRPGVPIHGQGQGLSEFLTGKLDTAIKAVDAYDKTTRVGEAKQSKHIPRSMPKDWGAIWFGNPNQRPIYIRVFPVAK